MHGLLEFKSRPETEASQALRLRIQRQARTEFPTCARQEHYSVYGPDHLPRGHEHRLSGQFAGLPTVMSQSDFADFDESLENADDAASQRQSGSDASSDSDEPPPRRRRAIPWRIRVPGDAAAAPPASAAVASIGGGGGAAAVDGRAGGVAEQYQDMCRAISQVPVASVLDALRRGGAASPTGRSSSRFGTCVLSCAGHMLGCRGAAILARFLKHVLLLTDLDLSRNSAPPPQPPPKAPAERTPASCGAVLPAQTSQAR